MQKLKISTKINPADDMKVAKGKDKVWQPSGPTSPVIACAEIFFVRKKSTNIMGMDAKKPALGGLR